MALTFNWLQLIQRLRQHIVNDFPSEDLNVTENEVLLYINEAMSFGLVGQVWGGAKVIGYLEVPESYLVTFKLASLQQDNVTKYWYSTMPQPPLSLPLGYSVIRVYFANATNGQGIDCFFIRSGRMSFRNDMPMPQGVRYWVENSKIWLAASDGSSLLNQDCYIQMPSTRAINITDPINLPDDAVEMIFTKVIARLKDRLQLPQDVVLDDISAGNKTS